MKKLMIISVIAVLFTACSCQRNVVSSKSSKERLIEIQDSLIKMMIQDNEEYYLDVLTETDIYWDYIEAKESITNK